MRLNVTWGPDQDPVLDNPKSIVWEDGRRGTLDEYYEHLGDTQFAAVNDSGHFQMHIFTDVVATVKYDKLGGAWAVSGDGIDPFGLDISDPNASDSEIRKELRMYPTEYRANIQR